MRKTKMPWFLCLLMLSTLGCAGTNGQRDLGGTTGRMASRSSQRVPDFVSLVKKLHPTVVNVSVSIVPPVMLQPGAQRQDDSADDRMEKFFGVPPPAAPLPQRQQGSGFIIGSEGIILPMRMSSKAQKKSSLN